MTVGICDDEPIVAGLLSGYIRKIDEKCNIEAFSSGDAVMKYLASGRPLDILLLDIDLKGNPDGMETAGILKKRQMGSVKAITSLPLIIFVTGMPERMQEAFSVHAFQFILKPVNEDEFAWIFKQAQSTASEICGKAEKKHITVQVGTSKRRVLLESIHYIESRGRKVALYLDDGVLEYYGRITDIEQEVDDSFYAVHRSFIVNMEYISDYERFSVKLTDGSDIPLSRNRYNEFIQAYISYTGRRLV